MTFSVKKKDINTDEFFTSLEFDFYRIQLKFAFRTRMAVRVYG